MQHLITKADLLEFDEFSTNIEDRVINPKINDAHVYDLRGLLPVSVLKTVEAANVPPVEWNSVDPYAIGATVSFEYNVYDAVTANFNVQPGTGVAEWALNTGATLRYIHLRPFLVWNTLRRFYVRAGRNITPSGITVPTDPQGTFQPISDQARASIIAEAIAKADFHRQDIQNYLNKNNLNYSGTCEGGTTRSGGRAWGI